MKHFKEKFHIILQEIFQFSLLTYLLLLLIETIKPGFVTYFFSINILLGVVLFSGIVTIITHTKTLDETELPHKVTVKAVLFCLLLAVGGAFLVLFETEALGIVSLGIGLLAAIVIFIFSLLIMSE